MTTRCEVIEREGWWQLGDAPDDGVPRLAELVSRRLDADPSITPEVAHTVLEALGADPDLRSGPGHSGIFVSSIRVRGFRGIGPQATLRLNPGPGLTLVVGRNGSGKSSFAEAAELTLTGVNRRWEGRSSVWREGWRNLHEGSVSRIDVELTTTGSDAPLTVTREW
ncbi:AAA family ATPase, partial [Nocardia gipuzkoensis]